MDAKSRWIILKNCAEQLNFRPHSTAFFDFPTKFEWNPPRNENANKNGWNWRFYSAHRTNVTSGTNRPQGPDPLDQRAEAAAITRTWEPGAERGRSLRSTSSPNTRRWAVETNQLLTKLCSCVSPFSGQNNQLPGRTGQLLSLKWMKWRRRVLSLIFRAAPPTSLTCPSADRMNETMDSFNQSAHWHCTFNNFIHFRYSASQSTSYANQLIYFKI